MINMIRQILKNNFLLNFLSGIVGIFFFFLRIDDIPILLSSVLRLINTFFLILIESEFTILLILSAYLMSFFLIYLAKINCDSYNFLLIYLIC